ncbi:MAG: DUF547 domain-containing protein [Marinomonas sp.]
MKRRIFTGLGAGALLSLGSAAAAQDQALPQVAVQAAPPVSAQFAQFIPSKTPKQHRIDYSIWDEAMRSLVVSMGPSLRKAAGSEVQNFGSRRRYGSNSRYRLEGTRLMFSFLDKEVINSFTEYRKDLEATADQLNISTLPRNEQLAFWTNLHNVAMVEQIAIAWPTRQPRNIKIGDAPLDEARFITINGVAMSPKDIRTQIVYPNWSDPRVIYGFWRGDIGGPALQRRAFNGENLKDTLERSAREFVNSLRGTQKNGSTLAVSDIYNEAAPYYFADFDRDLRTHLAGYANVEVQQILAKTSKVDASISEPDIADLAGGVREPSYSNITSDGSAKRFRIPQSMAQLLAQRERKFDIMEREGVRTGTVTFSPIELPGEDPKADEVE